MSDYYSNNNLSSGRNKIQIHGLPNVDAGVPDSFFEMLRKRYFPTKKEKAEERFLVSAWNTAYDDYLNYLDHVKEGNHAFNQSELEMTKRQIYIDGFDQKIKDVLTLQVVVARHIESINGNELVPEARRKQLIEWMKSNAGKMEKGWMDDF